MRERVSPRSGCDTAPCGCFAIRSTYPFKQGDLAFPRDGTSYGTIIKGGDFVAYGEVINPWDDDILGYGWNGISGRMSSF